MSTSHRTTGLPPERTVPVKRGWMIVDTTSAQSQQNLQRIIAQALELPLDVILAAWMSVDLAPTRLVLFPGEDRPSTRAIIAREIDQVMIDLQGEEAFEGLYVIILADETDESPAVIGDLVGDIYERTHERPGILALQQNDQLLWKLVDESAVEQVKQHFQQMETAL